MQAPYRMRDSRRSFMMVISRLICSIMPSFHSLALSRICMQQSHHFGLSKMMPIKAQASSKQSARIWRGTREVRVACACRSWRRLLELAMVASLQQAIVASVDRLPKRVLCAHIKGTGPGGGTITPGLNISGLGMNIRGPRSFILICMGRHRTGQLGGLP